MDGAKLKTITVWPIIALAAMFPCYSFFQMNMLNVIGYELSHGHMMNDASITWLSSIYIYSDALFLIPAGILLDRYKTKSILVIGLMTQATGAVLFAATQQFSLLLLIRFILGGAHAFALIGCLRYASLLVPEKQTGVAMALVTTIALFGGLIAQNPLSMLVRSVGSVNSCLIIGVVGYLLAILMLFLPKPSVKGICDGEVVYSLRHQLIEVIREKNVWLYGGIIGLMSIPMMDLGARWGITYLTVVDGLSEYSATSVTTALFLGFIAGTPFSGYLSDKTESRKNVMKAGSILLCLLMTLLINSSHSYISLLCLFFSIGFFSGFQVIGYTLISLQSAKRCQGLALGFASVVIMFIGAFSLNIYEFLYSIRDPFSNDFVLPMLFIPCSIAVAFLLLHQQTKNHATYRRRAS